MSSTTVRHAGSQDIRAIHALALEVQRALTATGSPQVIAPLQDVDKAIEQQGCFVLDQNCEEIVGCVIIRSLPGDYYLDSDFNINGFPDPRMSLHSMMLAPKIQGHGIGRRFFREVMYQLKDRAKSVLLDCWAGNDKLRNFYFSAGCTFVGTAPENDYEVAIFVYELPATEDGEAASNGPRSAMQT